MMELAFVVDIVGMNIKNVVARRQETDTVLNTKLFGRKVRHFNNSYMLITFTRTLTLFSCKLRQGSAVM